MSKLFSPVQLGTLTLPNRLVRSATAERLADAGGKPLPALSSMLCDLAEGGVGLIITGHMYVSPEGKCHPEMTGIHDDALLPGLSALAEAIHDAGGHVAVQINHGGMQCAPEAVDGTMAPSAIAADFLPQPAREMTVAEIEATVLAYGAAARRAKSAGFDAVQLHGAHGYLINQFLSPLVNRRTDGWGGGLDGRMRFLREVCAAVRAEVGDDTPVFIKLGVQDGRDGGLTLPDGVAVAAALEGMGLDGVEVSAGLSGPDLQASRAGVRGPEDEAYLRHLARAVREVTSLPVMAVGGFRSRAVMDAVLASGDADFVSMCRPLICEPDLPRRLMAGQARGACISGNRCWPKGPGEGIACRCLGEPAA